MKTSHSEVVAATQVNPGETLRLAREARGWSLGDVAAKLNLTPQVVGQLEAGSFERLPGHTFARGYVRAYAKLLEMDQASLVAEFDRYTGSDSGASSVHSLGRIEEPVRLSQGILKIVSLFLLVGLGIGAFFWWQGGSERTTVTTANLGFEHVEVEGADGTTEIHPLDEPEDQAVAEAQSTEELPPPVSAELAGQSETPEGSSPAEPTTVAPEVASTPPASAPAAPAAPTAPAAPVTPQTSQAPVVAAPTVTPAAGEARVNLQFTADCWTQLTDANGKVLLMALKRRGESVELVGKAPLELRLGFARGAQVLVDGQSVDVTPFIHNETARLKLGQ
ncbi:RodZ domain-containing protein [Aquipseudomonas campi]